MSNKEKKIPILSFYSGGGFLDMGFEMAGFEIVWSNEYDKVFSKLHAAGLTSWRKSNGNNNKVEIFNTKSILEVSSKEIIEEGFSEGVPSCFGIIGGPPCQDFSANGKMKGFEGERGKLTTLFFNKILKLKPTFFVMENVTGLIRTKSYKEHLSELIKGIQKEYYLDYDVLNAIEFGVPQHRERVFFIGVRKDKITDSEELLGKWFPWPSNDKYKNAAKKYEWPKRAIYGRTLTKPKDLPIELCVESCLVPHREMNNVPNANEFFNLYLDDDTLAQIEEGETNRPSFKRLHRFRYSPTACYGNNEVHLHPYKHRRLSVRETLRIQGVPDSYVLPPELPLSKKFKMIGNGVPVPLAKAVAQSLRSFIFSKKIIYP
jgi:DNA (cytosine-5)-methyltransferase 1